MSSIYTTFKIKVDNENQAKKIYNFVKTYRDLNNETDYNIELTKLNSSGFIISDDSGNNGGGFYSKHTEWDDLETLLDDLQEAFPDEDFSNLKSAEIVDTSESDGMNYYRIYEGAAGLVNDWELNICEDGSDTEAAKIDKEITDFLGV